MIFMRSAFSIKWKRSVQPRKQRKFLFNASLHTRGKFLNANLSKDLRKKYGIRSLRIRKGDKIRVLRGSFKGKEGIVDQINLKDTKVYVAGVEVPKRDGSKARRPLKPSNLQLVELFMDDKRRKARLEKNG